MTSRGVCDVTSHQEAPGTEDGVLLGGGAGVAEVSPRRSPTGRQQDSALPFPSPTRPPSLGSSLRRQGLRAGMGCLAEPSFSPSSSAQIFLTEVFLYKSRVTGAG